MRELTTHDIDTQLAEQLPARELMGCCPHPCASTLTHNTSTWGHNGTTVTTVNQGSFNGNNNGTGNLGLINIAGIGNGNLDGNTINLGL